MNRWGWIAARLWVGGVLTYAGFSKLMEPVENFHAAVLQYQVMSYDWSLAAAHVLPWVELVFGVFLFLGFLPRASAAAAALLSLVFLGWLGLSFLKTGRLPEHCGCFGQHGVQLSAAQLFFLDLANFLIALRLSLLKSHGLSLSVWLRKQH